MFESNQFPSLACIAANLWEQMRWSGRFGLMRSKNCSNFSNVIERIKILRVIISQVDDLKMLQGTQRYVYNTARWNHSSGAGFDAHNCCPDEIILSYLGNWNMEACGGSCSSRLLRGAALILGSQGVESAIDFLVHCANDGLFFMPQSISEALDLLILAHSEHITNPRSSWICKLVKSSHRKNWPKVKLPKRLLDADPINESIVEFVGALVKKASHLLDDLRRAQDFDVWIKCHHTLTTFELGCRGVIRKYGSVMSLATKAFFTRFEENSCDSGSISLLLDSPASEFHMATVAARSLQLKLGNESEWRFWQDRIVIPNDLKQIYSFADTKFLAPLPAGWKRLSEVPSSVIVLRRSESGLRDLLFFRSDESIRNGFTEMLLSSIELQKVGAFQCATLICRSVVMDFPLNWVARRELAISLDMGGWREEALSEIITAVSLAPADADNWYCGAVILSKLDRSEEASFFERMARVIEAGVLVPSTQDTERFLGVEQVEP